MALPNALIPLLHPSTQQLENWQASKTGENQSAPICKGSHTANQCTYVRDQQQHTSIVRQQAYALTAWHTIKSQERQCNQKYHTSLHPPTLVPTNNPQPLPGPIANYTHLPPPHYPLLIGCPQKQQSTCIYHCH